MTTLENEVAVTLEVDSETGQTKEKRDKAAVTINKMMAAVSSFYRYRENVIQELTSPCVMTKGKRPQKMYRGLLSHTGNLNESLVALHRVKVPKKMRRRLTPKEIEAFRSGLMTFRDRVIFDVLYESGLRISELIGLTLDDYSEPDLTEKVGTLYIITRDEDKNNREGRKKTGDRVIHIPMDVIFEVENYVTQHRPYVPGSKKLFVAQKGDTKGKSLGRKNVEKLFRECSGRTKVSCLPHELRHTHISELKEAGFDAAYIAVRTGNRTAQEDYTHITELSMRQALQRVWTAKEKREGRA